MRILYLSQYFPPEAGAPAARVSELAAHWVQCGHEVCVLTGFPNHPSGVVPTEYRGRLFAREEYRGVDVLRAYLYATPNRGVLKRGASFASFATSSVIAAALRREARRCDVIIATSPQFLCAVSGYAISRLLRIPYVLEVRDLWPQSIVEVGALPERHPAVSALRLAERFVYERAALLVGVTDAFADTWRRQGVDPAKIRVIKNGVDLERFRPRERAGPMRATLNLRDRFVVSYIGTHGLAHNLETLLEVAERFSDDPRVQFVLAGDGARREALQRQATAMQLGNVTFLGPRPRDEIPELLAASDLSVVMLKRAELFEQVLPSKMFEIMGCARPILLAVRGEAERLVREAGCGFIAAPEDADAMTEQIRLALADGAEAARRGQAGRAFVEAHFDRRRLAERYLDALAEVVAPR